MAAAGMAVVGTVEVDTAVTGDLRAVHKVCRVVAEIPSLSAVADTQATGYRGPSRPGNGRMEKRYRCRDKAA